jgi:hypothetical protein
MVARCVGPHRDEPADSQRMKSQNIFTGGLHVDRFDCDEVYQRVPVYVSSEYNSLFINQHDVHSGTLIQRRSGTV